MKILITTLALHLFICIPTLQLRSQTHKCGSHTHWQHRYAHDAYAMQRKQDLETFTAQYASSETGKRGVRNVIQIPVVVHVVYNTAAQNVSNAQIASQIDVLNRDFSGTNTDLLPASHPFYGYIADSEIEFCLADTDPDGNPTTGITRTPTSVAEFSSNLDDVKFPSSGGVSNWNPTKYLNMWVCPLEGTTLGYAAFPGDMASDPELDGVVIRVEAFGTTGTAGTAGFLDNALGRTATHEVGHWLNLFHIWGDATCGDDKVGDTPTHENNKGNSGCPSFPHNALSSCGTDSDGEMYMNYMDYTDDNCMNMFTIGQATRMRAALAGPRAAIVFSDGCSNLASVNENKNEPLLRIYPNPAERILTIALSGGALKNEFTIFDATGRPIFKDMIVQGSEKEISLENIPQGYYYFHLKSGNNTLVKPFSVIK
jgi:hypothetical protein